MVQLWLLTSCSFLKEIYRQRTTNSIRAKKGWLQGLLMSFRVCLFREHQAASHYLQGHKSHPINKRKEPLHTSKERQEVTVIFLTVKGLHCVDHKTKRIFIKHDFLRLREKLVLWNEIVTHWRNKWIPLQYAVCDGCCSLAKTQKANRQMCII